MKMNSVNRWLTLLANVAVFASIMFLAIEIRQNQTSIEESNRLAVLDARELEVEQFNDFRSMLLQDPDLIRIWNDGFADKELDPPDRQRFDLLCNNYLWISASSYERSIALGRIEAAAATTAIRASMIDESETFKECWFWLRDMFISYGVRDYVEAVESQVQSEVPAQE